MKSQINFIQIKTLPLILNTPLNSFSHARIEKWSLMNKGNVTLNCSLNKNTFFIKEKYSS